ncbi:MAG: LysM peptidoglycan-binding domain-containing protein [Verrucomicrobiales bacterium]|nr:LysM peptidoglycan-binding domain-containing protein [Verrucomicrobiales bacterium]
MSQSPGFQPLGRIPQSSGGRPNFRIAVFAFVALHAVFFAGLLLQGCGPKTEVAEAPPPTNGLPDINALFGEWTNTTRRASEPEANAGFQPPPATNEPVALDEPDRSEPPGDTGTTTNELAGGQTPGQRLLEGTQEPPDGGLRPGDQGDPSRDATQDLVQARQHVVERGETFWSISQKYGISVAEIQAANPGVVPEKLQPRHTLVIPAPKPRTATPEETYAGRVHTVKRGDTLLRLSETYGVSVKAIRQANNLRTDVIKVDDKLKIPAANGN